MMKPIRIIHLYPNDMNLYGDWGNVLTLKKRLEWRGYRSEVIAHNPGDVTDFQSGDIFIGGGGQDAGQKIVQEDLLTHAHELKQLVHGGVPMLMVCGMYQLFGRQFITIDGEIIRGAGILPLETRAGNERLIGNITLQSDEFGAVVGYENHSGQTILDEGARPLGSVVRGAGNNMVDNSEGIRLGNVIATYLHGPLLPKNPEIADFLIARGLARQGLELNETMMVDDAIAEEARFIAMRRPR